MQPQKSLKFLKKDLDLPTGAKIGLELDVLPYNNYARLTKALERSNFPTSQRLSSTFAL